LKNTLIQKRADTKKELGRVFQTKDAVDYFKRKFKSVFKDIHKELNEIQSKYMW